MIIDLIDRVKLLFSKNKALASALHEILGFYPHDLEIYRIALAHKSLAYRNQKGKPLNNERLEFLGDAILEAVVSDIVFHRYDRKREGFLTSTRSKIVQRSTLNKLASELGIDRLIKTSTHPNSHNNNIGGNAFEALVGAIYIDRGYGHCKRFVEKRIMGSLLDIDGVAQKEVNFKSKLLEWTQKNRIQLDYIFEQSSSENSNSPIFYSTITIEGLVAGVGKGYSKKESQQTAAKEALTKLRREPQFVDNIFRAKEKRTAMEADEICALPRIEEIEEEIRRENRENRENRNAARNNSNGNNNKQGQRRANNNGAAQPQNQNQKPQRDSQKAQDAKNAPAAKDQSAQKPQGNAPKQNAPQKSKDSAPKTKREGEQKPQPAAQKPQPAPQKSVSPQSAAPQPTESAEPAPKAENKKAVADDAQPENVSAKSESTNAKPEKTEAKPESADAPKAETVKADAPRAEAKTEEAPKTDSPKSETAERPARRRAPRRPKAENQTEAQTAPQATADTNDATPADAQSAPAAEKPAERPARRQRPPRRRNQAEDETAAAAAKAEREAIVRQAEEAAYTEE
ncbi:MAG: ribonuclease III [Bacteroidales bacterium]|nr:ribonuclease III [Bacteroidales bacterium]